MTAQRPFIPLLFTAFTTIAGLGLAGCADGLEAPPVEDGEVGERAPVGLDLPVAVIDAAMLDDGPLRVELDGGLGLELEPGAWTLDLGTIAIVEDGVEVGLGELFAGELPVDLGALEHPALVLLGVEAGEVDGLCTRYRVGRFEAELAREVRPDELAIIDAGDRVHAICLAPRAPAPEPSAAAVDEIAMDTEPYWGSGAYTLWVEKLSCNDPRDAEGFWGDGDEPVLRAKRDGINANNIYEDKNGSWESGDHKQVDRFVHFNSHVNLELFDYDEAFWNKTDKLGELNYWSSQACTGAKSSDISGSGGSKDWDYTIDWKVYGPNCPCQADQPAIYKKVDAESCTVTSSTVTHHTEFCSGGTRYRQAWGDVTRHCETKRRTYDVSCELNTWVSTQLLNECDKYSTGVKIGSAVVIGSCPIPEPCEGGLILGMCLTPELSDADDLDLDPN